MTEHQPEQSRVQAQGTGGQQAVPRSSATPQPTISEVAAEAGVGRATVARTLGGYGSVSVKTREKVLSAASRLGYRANALARSMSTGTTRTLGVVLADVANPFFATLFGGVEEVARTHGYDVMAYSTDENPQAEDRAVNMMMDKRVDGVIVAPARGRHEVIPYIEQLHARDIPVVFVDRLSDQHAEDGVVINNRDVSAQAVKALLARGHRRIGFVWGPVTLEPAADSADLKRIVDSALYSDGERLLGYLDALDEAGVPFDTALVSHCAKTETQAARTVKSWMSLADPPTAIFATETEALTGAIQALDELGLTCPEDVSLVGFDDSFWARVMRPPMSVVAQPARELGAAAASGLIERIESVKAGVNPDKSAASGAPQVRSLAATFIERESIAKPRARSRRAPARPASE